MYNSIKALEVIKTYLSDNYMTDVWRVKIRRKIVFTWKRELPTLIMSRLDYFIMTTGTVQSHFLYFIVL